ncbi:MAG: hypothetical protein MZV63_71015 [Marinilabiliales bacterium]|nr:hypothetical protein [Marinilabiliales bacterium]
MISALENTTGVTDITGRIIVRGIASTSAGSTGVEITGIDVEKEQEMFTLTKRLIPGTGSYFGSDTRLNSAFIGEKLAKGALHHQVHPDRRSRLSTLEQKEVSRLHVIEKLKPLEDQRFTTEKKLTEALAGLLSARRR